MPNEYERWTETGETEAEYWKRLFYKCAEDLMYERMAANMYKYADLPESTGDPPADRIASGPISESEGRANV